MICGTLILSACNDYLDINTNPNSLTTTNPDFVLSGALVTTAAIKLGTNGAGVDYAACWGGYFAASGSYSPSGDYVRYYNNPATYSSGPWANWYSNLSNYNYVEQNAANSNYAAICEIMKAYQFQNLVDVFGDVPYKQALTGFTYLYPVYDNQEDIYKSLAVKLDSAVMLIKNTSDPAVTATADVMFHGDMTKWAKLGNTIHLRLLLRQSEVGDNAYITSEMNKITSNGMGFLGAGEDALINPGYSKGAGLQSPMWESFGLSYSNTVDGRAYCRASDFAVSLLKGLSDPRIDYLFLSPGQDGTPGVKGTGTYSGIPFGAAASTQYNTSNSSGIGVGVVSGPTQDAVFFSASHSLFLQAEAMLRGWLSGDAKTTYNMAISESFRVLKVAGAEDYYTTGAGLWPNSDFETNLTALITQKWISGYALEAIDAWSDFRRLGIPNVPKSADPTLSPSVPYPVRLLYPQSEYNNNPNNVKAAVDANGGDVTVFSPAIFWDVD